MSKLVPRVDPCAGLQTSLAPRQPHAVVVQPRLGAHLSVASISVKMSSLIDNLVDSALLFQCAADLCSPQGLGG